MADGHIVREVEGALHDYSLRSEIAQRLLTSETPGDVTAVEVVELIAELLAGINHAMWTLATEVDHLGDVLADLNDRL